MKYISLDIETTGLDPIENDILEIGALIEDTNKPLSREKLPTFHCYIWKENYRGNPFALAMNAHIFEKILELKASEGTPSTYDMTKYDRILKLSYYVWSHFSHWLSINTVMGGMNYVPPPWVVAGKNVAGFDLKFLSKLPGEMPKFHHRVIDPGMMYFNPLTDEVPPDLKTCKQRAGLPELVTHEALDDAWDVIQLVRAKFPRVYE